MPRGIVRLRKKNIKSLNQDPEKRRQQMYPHGQKEIDHIKESGKDFAKCLCDEYFGEGNYSTKGQSDYSKIRKWGDRGFE